jgi:hypothetical protein
MIRVFPPTPMMASDEAASFVSRNRQSYAPENIGHQRRFKRSGMGYQVKPIVQKIEVRHGKRINRSRGSRCSEQTRLSNSADTGRSEGFSL